MPVDDVDGCSIIEGLGKTLLDTRSTFESINSDDSLVKDVNIDGVTSIRSKNNAMY